VHTLLRDDAPQVDGDGRQTRDFIYVHDVAGANIALLFRENLGSRVINVGRAQHLNTRDARTAL
jgi:UDP-glucose 4-epimerase